MKIGIFGGSFNPPHKMHEVIAKELIEKHYVDKIIFVPTGNQYEKKDLIDEKKRFEMLEIIASKNECFLVSDFELGGKLKYTYQTLEHFKKIYPNDEIYFVLGADNLEDMKNWKKRDLLLENYHFLVVRRGNNKVRLEQEYEKYQNHIEFVPILESELSSTQIRYLLKNNSEKVKDKLDCDVFLYMKTYGLYQ